MKNILTNRTMNSLYKYILSAGLIVAMASCGGETKDASADEQRVENVKVLKLEEVTIERDFSVSTTLEGYENVSISPSLTGIIEHIYVEVGTQVSPGTLLVRMDQTQLNSVKLAFSNASVEFDRVSVLNETGAVSKQVYDQTKLAYDQTKENLEFLTANTFVKSPIRGVVSARNFEPGELYAGNPPILEITQTHILKALIAIPESYVPYIKTGMKLAITSDIYRDQEFEGVVEIVYPTIDPNTHTFNVKVRIPNADGKLKPGMYVKTSMNLEAVNAIMVPYQAVLKLIGSNERYVFINRDGNAKRTNVTLGKRIDDMVEIQSSEIAPGDEIVVTGQARLVDGVKLNIVE
ncbi:efflux RND transporter periplasmic adaptor subunit [Xiashengella succiniciproducens]|jgi:membrane fusion protein (multidrug efflux system)|uniref:Efflux RND transporter periplasmic adaptor subunit n=1 Tax=Xiashengella succiniciproducens TaxID=2949635 RepID=A0A9J6ZRQ6_9BACT|nr:efflux RND transporter periplasmic adaptor subunit [Alkaliflexus sp. Ai-910]URW80538.1 efflux RND transporter periplasmic adaptor subunit [Alkaliflexus sp. Ai-910]